MNSCQTLINSGVTVDRLVSPRVGSEQLSLLMRKLHRPRQQMHLSKAPANFRRAFLAAYPALDAVSVAANTA